MLEVMRWLTTVVLLLAAAPLWAGPVPQPTGARISLSATAADELPNDEVVARFRIVAEGKRAARLRAQVNRVAAEVRRLLAREQGVVLETTGRRLEPVYDYDAARRKNTRTGWRMTQTGMITSRNLDAVAAWLEAIEEAGARLDDLHYRISREMREKAAHRLEIEAVRAFRDRAAAMARALDAADYRIVRLQTETQMPAPIMPRMAMMEARAAAPALSPGKGLVSVTVRGEIELPPRRFSAK